MIFSKKHFVFLLAFFLFFSFVNASVSVALQPKSGASMVEIYQYELAEYYLIINNNGKEEVNYLNLVVSVDDALAIIDGEKEKQEITVTVASIPAGESELREIKVKALQRANRTVKIYVHYGFETDLLDSYSKSLNLIENPVHINARLDKAALNPGEQGIVFLDLSNASDFDIKNVRAELIVPEDFSNDSAVFEFKILEKGEAFTNKAFPFTVPENVNQESLLLLKVYYEDASGSHSIEKSFSVDIQNRGAYLFVIILGIVALVALSYVLRKKNRPVQKVDSSEIKITEIGKRPEHKEDS
jgi:hypothetical protein